MVATAPQVPVPAATSTASSTAANPGTGPKAAAAAAPLPPTQGTLVLSAGGTLAASVNAYKCGDITLQFKPDQTLVISRVISSSLSLPLFRSDNSPSPTDDPKAVLTLRNDGLLQILSGKKEEVWSANSGAGLQSVSNTALFLQDNGHAVIYQNSVVVWRSTNWKQTTSDPSRLDADEYLPAEGQQTSGASYLTASNGSTRLVLTSTGNLLLYDSTKADGRKAPFWSSDSSWADPYDRAADKKLWMRGDDLLLVAGTGWSAGARRRRGAGNVYLLVENRVVSIVSEGVKVWSSDSKATVTPLQPQSYSQAQGGSRLRRGEFLAVGQQLVSPNGSYVAEILNNNCFALRRKKPDGSYDMIWSTPTGASAAQLILQWNGDLGLTNQAKGVWWNTATDQPYKDPVLVLRDDGMLYIDETDVPWRAEKTNGTQYPATTYKTDYLRDNEGLLVGQLLWSRSGEYSLQLLDSVTLLVQNKQGGDKTYYYLKIAGAGAKSLRVRSASNRWALEVLDTAGKLLYTSDDKTSPTAALPAAAARNTALTLRDDGTARLAPARTAAPVWSTDWLPSGAAPSPASRLPAGVPLRYTDSIVSPSGRHFVTLLADGNLGVWLNPPLRPGQARWATSDRSRVPAAQAASIVLSAVLLPTGVLAVYSTAERGGAPVWTLNAPPVGGVGAKAALWVEMLDGGSFVIKVGGSTVWGSGSDYNAGAAAAAVDDGDISPDMARLDPRPGPGPGAKPPVSPSSAPTPGTKLPVSTAPGTKPPVSTTQAAATTGDGEDMDTSDLGSGGVLVRQPPGSTPTVRPGPATTSQPTQPTQPANPLPKPVSSTSGK